MISPVESCNNMSDSPVESCDKMSELHTISPVESCDKLHSCMTSQSMSLADYEKVRKGLRLCMHWCKLVDGTVWEPPMVVFVDTDAGEHINVRKSCDLDLLHGDMQRKRHKKKKSCTPLPRRPFFRPVTAKGSGKVATRGKAPSLFHRALHGIKAQ